jgi:ATP-dependent helicase/nuclease subunit A
VSAAPPKAPPDHEARREATTRFDTNLVVTAGAGTGKTAILVERALNLIGSGHATLDALALITFTDKAAAELRVRLGGGLDRLLRLASGRPVEISDRHDADRSWRWLRSEGIPEALIRARCLAALTSLDAASVGTIHAFCLDLLRRHPREAGIDPHAAAADDAGLERIFDEAWDEFLKRDDGPRARAAAWRRALDSNLMPETLRELGRALARFTLPEAALRAQPALSIPRVLGGAIAERLAAVTGLLERAQGLAPRMSTLLAMAAEALERIGRDGLDTTQARDLARALDDYPSIPTPGARLQGASPDELREAASAACGLLRMLSRVDEEAVAAAHDLARALALRAQRRALSSGVIPFDAMLRLARSLLSRHARVRRKVRSRFSQLLVDEFQDTDPLQYEVLFLIAAASSSREPEEAEPEADPWSGSLEPGRLFIVGDPQQSIYRFRGADIAAFRAAVARIESTGGATLHLGASFRSPGTLLRPIDRLFAGWLGPEDGRWTGDHQPPYRSLVPARPPLPDHRPRVAIWSVDAGPAADAAGGRRAEALAIAAHIALASHLPHDDGARFRRFALLFRSLANASDYARALRQAGLPCLLDGGRDFASRPEVLDLLTFLRACASPNDGPSWLALVRSPLGAVPDAELQRYVRDGWRLSCPSPGARPPDPVLYPSLRRTFTWMLDFLRRARGLPPDEVIQAALATTPLLLLHAASHDGSQRLANLRKCESLARELADRGLTLQQIVAEIEATFTGDRGEAESPLADETVDAVRLLSVHKAKGLEFDVVFVPDLGRRDGGDRARRSDAAFRGAGAPADATGDDAGPSGAAIVLPDGRRNALRVAHDLDALRHEEAEERRVFYVACTRAREDLILVNSRRGGRAAWRDRLSVLGYDLEDRDSWPDEGALFEGLVMHRVVRDARPKPSETPRCEPEVYVVAASRHRRIAATLATLAAAPLSLPSAGTSTAHSGSGPGAADAGVKRPQEGPGPLAARLAGSAVHAALQRWDFHDAAALHGAARRALGWIAARERRDETGAAALEIDRILRGFLAGALPARLRRGTILAREAPLALEDASGALWAGACDLIFRDGDDVVVADYKTDALPDAAAIASLYRGQMAIYLDAVRKVLPSERVRGELLLLRTGAVIPID